MSRDFEKAAKPIVLWVRDRLMCKQYYNWTALEVYEKLVKKKRYGGASLTPYASKMLLDLDFSGCCLEEMVQSVKNGEENDALFARIQEFLELEDFSDEMKLILIHLKEWVENMLVIRVSAHTVDILIISNSLHWLDMQVGAKLKECFEKGLDKPFVIENTKDVSGFYNREGFKTRVRNLVEGNVKHFWKNKYDRADRQNEFSYGIIIGNGKTRACNEIRNIILGMDLSNQGSVTFRKLHCYFPFNNGYTLDKVEYQNPAYEVRDGKSIGLRILCSIYGVNVTTISGKPNFRQAYQDTNFFTG